MSIPRETIREYEESTSPGVKFWQWTCPQCQRNTYGDSRKDSLFEIRHDPLCVYCRCKNGTMRLTGSKFEHVKP